MGAQLRTKRPKRRLYWPKRAQLILYQLLRTEIEAIRTVWNTSEPDIAKVLESRKDSQEVRTDSIRDMVRSSLSRAPVSVSRIHQKIIEASKEVQQTAIHAVNEALGVQMPTPEKVLGASRDWSTEATEQVLEVVNKLRTNIMDAVAQGVRNGVSRGELKKIVKKIFEVSKEKAIQVSSNSVGNLFGEVVKDAQEALGIRRYRWMTQADERVRRDHYTLHETIQRWDKPPIVNRKLGFRAHPGGDFNCRCFALPVKPEGS